MIYFLLIIYQWGRRDLGKTFPNPSKGVLHPPKKKIKTRTTISNKRKSEFINV